MENTKSSFGVKQIVTIGMFCALSYAIMLLSKLIPVNVAGFLTFDLKDVAIAICGFLFGPVPAIIVSVIVSVVEMLTISTTGPIGLIMNVISTCAFVCPAALFYKSRRRFSGAIIGIIIGVFCMTAAMLLWNWLITPLYMGVPRDAVVAMLIPVFLPFNLLKGAINAALTILLYKPVVTALRKARLINASPARTAPRTGMTIGVTLVSLFILASLVLVVLVWTHVI